MPNPNDARKKDPMAAKNAPMTTGLAVEQAAVTPDVANLRPPTATKAESAAESGEMFVPGTNDMIIADASPSVEPVFLRPVSKVMAGAQAKAVPVVAPVQEPVAGVGELGPATDLTPANQALVEAITGRLKEMLTKSLHETVAQAVRASVPGIAVVVTPAASQAEVPDVAQKTAIAPSDDAVAATDASPAAPPA